MKTSSCRYCRLPAVSRREGDFFCGYGCFLAYNFFSLSKIRLFIKLLIGGLLYLAILVIPRVNNLYGFLDDQQILWILFSLTLLILLILGLPFFIYIVKSIIQRGWFHPDLLMIFAILIDFGYSSYLTFFPQSYREDFSYNPFFLSGLFLFVTLFISYWEARCRLKAYDDITRIRTLRKLKAKRIFKNQIVETNVSELNVDDLVQVEPGEVIPCDGIIQSGATSVDESMFTAEGTIIFKEKGDKVTGASMNRDATIIIKLINSPKEHYLEKTLVLLEQALENRSRFQQVLEKMIPYVILFICAVAVGIFCYRLDCVSVAIKSAISVFVVTSFCAFIRIMPMIFVLGIGKAARHGALVTSSVYFKILAKLKYLFFDKTGTLTKGKFYFSKLFLESNVNQGELLSLLFSLEAKSKHPLSKGVQTHPWYLEVPKYEVMDFESHPGLGISGRVCAPGRGEVFVTIGNQRFLKRYQMQISRFMRMRLEEMESVGETVILCGWNGQMKGVLGFTDTLNSEVSPLLARLKKLHIRPIMITGDHEEMISNLTYTHGLKDVYTRCLPEEKIRKITNRKGIGTFVGMVGNVRDEPTVYAAADVGLMIGTGTYLVERVADVILSGKRLLNITNLIRFSRVVYGTFAVGYILGVLCSIAGITLALLGFIQPTGALLAMVISRFVFVTLPLRLREINYSRD